MTFHGVHHGRWMGSSKRDPKAFPAEVKDVMGYALYTQLGLKAASAKPLAGFGGASILEVVEDFQTNTYHAVYTVKFSEFVYVLHTFQKKSKKGIATPNTEMDHQEAVEAGGGGLQSALSTPRT